MKKLILSLGLLLALVSQAADVKISQLPLGTAASSSATDSFPYVAVSTGVTKRLTLWDLINLPPMASTYAPLSNPTFTGTVTATTFVGAFSGTVTNATHGATVATTTNASYYPLFVPSSTNGNQVFNLGVGLSFNPSTNNLSTTTFTGALVGNASTATALTGTLGVAGGGTGLTSGSAGGLLGFTGSTTAASMAAGSAGQIVRSAGTGIPTWSTATYPTSGTAGGVMAFSGANTVVSSAAGSSGQLLQSAGTTTPGWSTATYPATTTANRLLYSSATNTVADLATANTGVLVTSAAGVPSITSCTTANRVLRTDGTTLSCAQVNLNTDATGSISETNGGTGQSTYTLGNILYSSATNTLAKLAGNTTASIQFLGQTGTGAVSAAPVWTSFTPYTIQSFTSGTAQTYTVPTSPRKPIYIKVHLIGGGGGGSGSGTAGGNTGIQNGGDTTFTDGTVTLTAGGGQASSRGGNGGTGGTASIGTAAGTGIVQAGDYGDASNIILNFMGGRGGRSIFPGAGQVAPGAAAQSNANTSSGSGGSGGGTGATASSVTGSGGGAGGYVEYVFGGGGQTALSLTYTYTVGAGGNGASSGTNGFGGSNGAAGRVWIEEFYQ